VTSVLNEERIDDDDVIEVLDEEDGGS
ncbi:hypothetical protein Tco_0094147, partial [Tanacetum coccineum]